MSNRRSILAGLPPALLLITATSAPAQALGPGNGGGADSGSGPARPGLLVGSWEQTVKLGDTWEDDDPKSTVEALLKTHQNFYVYQIDTDAKWNCLPQLLKAAHGTDIKIIAAMNSPLENSATCRWFDTNHDGVRGDSALTKPKTTYDHNEWQKERDYTLVWLDAWKAAARHLSKLSLDFPENLIGFAINDFQGSVESADYPQGMVATRLTKHEIKEIYDACHSQNQSFGFYPVLPFSDLGRFICPGVVLGANYGVRMQDGDSMVVDYDVPFTSDPLASRFSFFQHTASGQDHVFRSVRVNGVEVWPAPGADPIPLNNTGRPDVEFTTLALDLHSGMNRIEVRLDVDAQTNGCTQNGGGVDLWYLWNVKLQYWAAGTTGPIDFDLLPRFEVNGDSSLWEIACWGALFKEFGDLALHDPGWLSNDDVRCAMGGITGEPVLPDDPIRGRMLHRLLSAPNDRFLLDGVIDGILPYVGDTELYGASDALDPSRHFPRLLRDVQADLGKARLIPIHTALAGVVIDPDILVHRLQVSAAVAHAAGVYRFPLGMVFMDPADRRGIFAPYDPAALTLQWPTAQETLPGWYQEWVHDAPATGSADMTVEIWDTRDPASGDAGMLLKTVEGGGLASAYEVDPFDDDQTHVMVPLTGSLSSSASDPVRIGMWSSGGVPINTKVKAIAYDASTGLEIPASEWKFESGISDPNTLAIFQKVSDFFARAWLP